jgi:anti-sigma regulatory factor (Ser/Thr protein kinase)
VEAYVVSGAPGGREETKEGRSRRAHRELRVSLASPAEVAGFRRELRGLLAGTSLNDRDCKAIVLAATEAVDNALLACDERMCSVEAAVSLVSGYVCIEIRDAGAGFKGVCTEPARLASETDEHGRGLHLMHELMESLELVPRSRGTLVRMTKRLAERASPEAEASPRRRAC